MGGAWSYVREYGIRGACIEELREPYMVERLNAAEKDISQLAWNANEGIRNTAESPMNITRKQTKRAPFVQSREERLKPKLPTVFFR